jgi:ribosomal protein L32
MGVFGYESLSLFVSVADFIIISIITTSVVLLSAVNLFILSIKTKMRNLNTKNFILMSIISAVLLICIMIYYIIAMGTAFYKGFTLDGVPFPPGIRFWIAFNPGFGLFLPFISAILSFVGVGLFKSYSKRKDEIIKYKMDATTGYVPYAKQMRSINFCPECGKKILHTGVKFCTNCGFNLK